MNPDDLERRLNEIQEQLDWVTDRAYWMWMVGIGGVTVLGLQMLVNVVMWFAASLK